MVLVLGYGSLSPARMEHNVGHVDVVGAVVLRGYRVRFQGWGLRYGWGGVANLVAEPGSRALGIIYRISPAQLARLDRIEEVSGGKTVRRRMGRWWYYARSSYEEEHKPSPAYLRLHRELLREARALLSERATSSANLLT